MKLIFGSQAAMAGLSEPCKKTSEGYSKLVSVFTETTQTSFRIH
jgi:hypothetical protein